MSYYLEPYAEFINFSLPCIFALALIFTLVLHLHTVTRVTPRVDQLNGFKTTKRFKINRHQSAVYRRCFTASDLKLKKIFKAQQCDLLIFKFDKYLIRFVLVFITLGSTFLRYTHTLVF